MKTAALKLVGGGHGLVLAMLARRPIVCSIERLAEYFWTYSVHSLSEICGISQFKRPRPDLPPIMVEQLGLLPMLRFVWWDSASGPLTRPENQKNTATFSLFCRPFCGLRVSSALCCDAIAKSCHITDCLELSSQAGFSVLLKQGYYQKEL